MFMPREPNPRIPRYDAGFVLEEYRFTKDWGRWVVDFSPQTQRHICINDHLLKDWNVEPFSAIVELPVWIPNPERNGIIMFDDAGSEYTTESVYTTSTLVLRDVDFDYGEHSNGFNIISDQALRRDGTVKHYTVPIEDRPREMMHHWTDQDGNLILVAHMKDNAGRFGATAWVGGTLSEREPWADNRIEEVDEACKTLSLRG